MKKSKMHEVTISADSPDRIDNLLAKHTDFSRSQIQHLLQQGAVLCNDRAIKKKGQVLAPGEYKISLYIEFEVDDYQIPESTLPVTVAFEDDFLMVINKSPGVSVHPGAGQKSNTLINALIGKIDRSGYAAENMRPGIVHRLDKDTSGLMIVAKNAEVAQKISEMLKLRQVERVYHAVVWGVPFPYSSTINMPITRSHNNRQLMAIATEGGRDAVTHYKVLHIFADHVASLLECRLETGRTHQIRVHLAAVGHGVVGDKSYGKKSKKRKAAQHLQLLAQFPRQALHSTMLTFLHPVTNKLISLEAPLPSDMSILLEHLHNDVPSTD